MDSLGWELERQRAALRALLGGGETGEGESFGEEPLAWEEPSGWGGKTSSEGTRRSLAGPETVRRHGAGRAGRYAGERGEAGGALAGAPGAWEMVCEAERAALEGEAGGPEPLGGAEYRSGEAGAPARRRAETGVSPFSRRYVPEEIGRAPRIGTGGAAELRRPSGGPGDSEEERETAAGTGAEAGMAAGRTGEGLAGWGPAGWDPAVEAGGALLPGEGRGGGEAAGDASAVIRRAGAGMVRSGRDAGTAGQGARLSRTLPWGDGWESPALRAEDGAKALSREVQRDARRYDGGFPIY